MATLIDENDEPVLLDLGTGDSWKRFIPSHLLDRYEVHNFRRAAEILSIGFPAEFEELCNALTAFNVPKAWIVEAGGNESKIPKRFTELLRPKNWYETRIHADLEVRRTVVGERVRDLHIRGADAGQQKLDANGNPKWKHQNITHTEPPIVGYVDGHKIDYVKNGVAFDLEWNSKDQTFDRDLFAFRTFFECQAVEVGVLVTRSADLNRVFTALGPEVQRKYGASTTWIGKLLYRLKSGRSGGCPVLVFGIKSPCVPEWNDVTSRIEA